MGQRTSGQVPGSCPPLDHLPPAPGGTTTVHFAGGPVSAAGGGGSTFVYGLQGSTRAPVGHTMERLANTGEIALYVQDRVAPVGRVLMPRPCQHRKRVPVLLVLFPYDHVADLCTGCGRAFPDMAYLQPTCGW